MSPTAETQLAYCRSCGKALAAAEQIHHESTVYCSEHAPRPAAGQTVDATSSPWTAPPPPRPASASSIEHSPGLAFVLGLIPGVGAIYNGQYAKGLVHVVVVGLLISIANSHDSGDMGPLFGMLAAAMWPYMAFEAYHTAKRRERGEPVDEFSSILPMHGSGFPIAPVVLIVTGVLFLLNNLEILRLQHLIRYWPVLLIVFGVYLLVSRLRDTTPAQEVRGE